MSSSQHHHRLMQARHSDSSSTPSPTQMILFSSSHSCKTSPLHSPIAAGTGGSDKRLSAEVISVAKSYSRAPPPLSLLPSNIDNIASVHHHCYPSSSSSGPHHSSMFSPGLNVSGGTIVDATSIKTPKHSQSHSVLPKYSSCSSSSTNNTCIPNNNKHSLTTTTSTNPIHHQSAPSLVDNRYYYELREALDDYGNVCGGGGVQSWYGDCKSKESNSGSGEAVNLLTANATSGDCGNVKR